MAYDKQYYDEKKRIINMKYIKTLEELVDEQAALLNKFFAYKGELNEQLREIAKREIEAGEGAESAKEAGEGLEEKLAEAEVNAAGEAEAEAEAAAESEVAAEAEADAAAEGEANGSEQA